MFDEVRMSERTRLAKVTRWNRLWLQPARFHRNVSAQAPNTSYRQKHTQTVNRCFGQFSLTKAKLYQFCPLGDAGVLNIVVFSHASF